MGMARHDRPSASISAAVVSRLPAMGAEISGAFELEDWARPSPSRTVRAVMTTSKPRRARATAPLRPMPRLAPVTSATRRSGSLRSATRWPPFLASWFRLTAADDLHHHGGPTILRSPPWSNVALLALLDERPAHGPPGPRRCGPDRVPHSPSCLPRSRSDYPGH